MKHRKSGWVNGGEIVRLAMPNEVGEESTANETGANVVAVGLTVRGCAFRFRRMSLVCLACVLHVVGDRAGSGLAFVKNRGPNSGPCFLAVPFHQLCIRANFREKSGPQFGTLFS